MSYEDKPMKKQWLEVEGRLTPVILPQIYNHEKQDWEVTSEQNPLPTRVIGSNVEELQSYADDDMYSTVGRWRYISGVIGTGPSELVPVDVSGFNKKSIYFENNTNHDITSIEVYGTSVATIYSSRDRVRIFSFSVANLEPGESVFITEEEFPELKQPCIGLAMRTARENGVDAEDSDGTATVRFYGYGK